MCFSLEWFKDLLIWLVIVGTIIALLRLLLPWVLGMFGVAGDVLMRAINIAIACVLAIAVIILVFDLIECVIGHGIPRLPRS